MPPDADAMNMRLFTDGVATGDAATDPTSPDAPGRVEDAGPRARWPLLVWAVPALISALQCSVLCPYAPSAEPALLGRALAGGLVVWYGWAALAPLVLALGRRFPVAPPRLWPHLGLHALFAAPVVLAHTALTTLCSAWVFAEHDWSAGFLVARYHEVLVGRLILELTIYAAVLGVGHLRRAGQRLRERDQRLAEVEAELTRAQLAALRAQLQPHFLFNTLNSVAVLARAGEGQVAAAMLADLGELLRRSLAHGEGARVPLREELELSERYLNIEAVRFGAERLRVRRRVAPDTLEARVPGFLLQPLVENAVRHGATRREGGGGEVELRSWREGPKLCVEVRDNGPGWSAGPVHAGHGVGLANVRERLRRLYRAGEHALLCGDVPEGDGPGGCVRLVLPFQTT